jgi:hypothetical protein
VLWHCWAKDNWQHGKLINIFMEQIYTLSMHSILSVYIDVFAVPFSLSNYHHTSSMDSRKFLVQMNRLPVLLI